MNTPNLTEIERIADAQVAAGEHGSIPDSDMDYEDWLEETGLDDSFVGDGVSVPGTGDIYDAMMRAVERRQAKMDAPEGPRAGEMTIMTRTGSTGTPVPTSERKPVVPSGRQAMPAHIRAVQAQGRIDRTAGKMTIMTRSGSTGTPVPTSERKPVVPSGREAMPAHIRALQAQGRIDRKAETEIRILDPFSAAPAADLAERQDGPAPT